MSNQTRNTGFCNSNGIFIVIATLLTALIGLCIVLYLNVTKLQDMISSQIKTDAAVKENLINEIVLMRKKIIDNHEIVQKKIETSVEQIQKEVNDELKKFENGIVSIKKEININLESLKCKLSKPVNEEKTETNCSIIFIKKEILTLFKDLDIYIKHHSYNLKKLGT
jgi:hypothetical protein